MVPRGFPPEGLKPSRSVYVAFPRIRSIVKDRYIAHGPVFGGGSRIRTGDIQLAKLTLCQLSYARLVRKGCDRQPARLHLATAFPQGGSLERR